MTKAYETSSTSPESKRRRKRRVVHLTTVHHPLDPRIFRKEVLTLRDAGYDVRLVAPHTKSEVVDGVPIVALPRVEGRYSRIRLQRRVYRLACRLNADCYHFHDPELIPVGYLLKRTVGARVVYDMHEDYRWHGPVEGRLIRLLERWCFSWVDHVVVANAKHTEITESSGVPTTRIANYVKPVRATSSSQPAKLSHDGPLRLIYTGVMSDQGGRGLTQLIRLAEVIKQEGLNWKLDLVGVCYLEACRRRAEARIRRGGLETVIRRVGWDSYVPWEEMVPYLQKAHVGLVLGTAHPNHIQKIPTKFYEYLHFGLPILCSDFPYWQQFIHRHACGITVPPGNVHAVVAAMKEWVDRPDRYRTQARAARVAASQFQWQCMEPRLLHLYEKLLT